MEPVDEHFLRAAEALGSARPPASAPPVAPGRLAALLDAQARSRHLDLAARWLQQQGEGFYTIGSAGHESNAVLGLLSRADDPALLHYRSGAFYAARAAVEGHVDAVRETLRSLTCSALDPMSGGRHKVTGHPALHIVPQTSTIASHLPRAVGLAFSLGLARRLGHATPWPDDALVVTSLGDASVNHSTAAGALNTAAYLAHRGRDCPLLVVCEDNGIGISTRTPRGWTAAALGSIPGVAYVEASGHDPVGLLDTAERVLARVRERRTPAVLHLRTVRFMGHAGSDVETAYRSRRSVEAEWARDPLLGTARALVEHAGWSGAEVVARYEEVRREVMACAHEVAGEPRLTTRAEVVAPLAQAAPVDPPTPPTSSEPPRAEPPRAEPPRAEAPAAAGARRTLAQSLTATLAEEMAGHDDVLVLGEDVAAKGGVYGVTRGLLKTFGEHRVLDTLLDEQTVLGTALGASLAGFLPVPEIQYLAYLHNAEDQLRGEGASLAFFSAGQYSNGMVVRVAGLAYQKGFGGHFHNDNSVAVLRDIPGLVLAVASHPDTAPGLLRSCLDLARREGRVCVFLEPIARYHTRDLLEGDEAWLAGAPDATARVLPGEVVTHGDGADLLLVTFGNGVFLARRAAAVLAEEGIACTVLDLAWLSPLPAAALLRAAAAARAVLVVDETRASGGVSEGVVTALVEGGVRVPMARAASADSFVPLGPAAATVLLGEDEIIDAGRRLAADPA